MVQSFRRNSNGKSGAAALRSEFGHARAERPKMAHLENRMLTLLRYSFQFNVVPVLSDL